MFSKRPTTWTAWTFAWIWLISLTCVLNDLYFNYSMPCTLSLEDFILRVLHNPSTRRIDFKSLTPTVQLISSVCSALRATDHVQEISFPKYSNFNPFRTATWAWIAFGILHRDSCSTLKLLDINDLEGSDESMEIVSRILSTPHPGKELLMAIAPECSDIIQSEEVPLPRGTMIFVSLKAHTELKERPNRDSTTLLAHLRQTITNETREVLVEISSGWTCILVPAYGIAWISTDSIIAKHEEPSVVDPDDTAIRSNGSLKVLVGLYYLVVERILPLIGHSLESLEVMSSDVVSVCDNCPNLKHLEICSTDSSTVLSLLRVYQQDQYRVECLKFDDDTKNEKGYMNESLLLRNPSAKALRRLRIYFRHGDLNGLASLIESCHSDKTLEVSEVLTIDLNDDHREILQEKLNELNGNQLAIQTSNAVKLAFLSVVAHHRKKADITGMTHLTPALFLTFSSLLARPSGAKFCCFTFEFNCFKYVFSFFCLR